MKMSSALLPVCVQVIGATPAPPGPRQFLRADGRPRPPSLLPLGWRQARLVDASAFPACPAARLPCPVTPDPVSLTNVRSGGDRVSDGDDSVRNHGGVWRNATGTGEAPPPAFSASTPQTLGAARAWAHSWLPGPALSRDSPSRVLTRPHVPQRHSHPGLARRPRTTLAQSVGLCREQLRGDTLRGPVPPPWGS